MRGLELRHLRVVCAVADAGSLTRAAAPLGVSQPALTAQVQRIERRFGGGLFVRGHDGMQLTELGGYVVRAGRSVLAEADRLVDGVERHVRELGERDVVRLGGPPGPRVPAWAAQVTASMGASVPIEVSVDADDLLRRVADHHIDFVLLAFLSDGTPDFAPRLPASVTSRLLAVEPECVALPDSHPLADRDHVDLAELADDDWIALPLHVSTEQVTFTRVCHAAGFAPRVRHQVSDGVTIRSLVADGAVSLACVFSRGGHGVAIVPFDPARPIARHVVLAWHSAGRHAGRADAVFRAAERGYGSLVEATPALRARWHGANGVPTGLRV